MLIKFWNLWKQFWFDPIDPIVPAVFRICFCTVVFLNYGLRFLEFDLFFSNEGMISADTVKGFLPAIYKPTVYLFAVSDTANYWIHIFLLLGLVALAVGLIGRNLCWLVFLLHLSLIHRNPAIVYGVDLMTTAWLYCLCFMQSNRRLSLWVFLKRKYFEKNSGVTEPESKPSDLVNSMGIRFLQIQLCVVYGWTGWEKLKGSDWWEGSAVWYVLQNDQLVLHRMGFLSHFPLAVGIFTFLTLIFEIYFPVMVWNSRVRPYWLIMGLGFHISIAIFMGLWFFSLTMLSCYLIFLKKQEITFFLNKLKLKY